MERIIIYGGSFDPVHNGHLRIAQAASMALGGDVVFVPAKAPRWKTPEASSADRLEMLKRAISEDGATDYSIDLFEMNSQSEVNYTVDTVRHFQDAYPGRDLCLLIGADEVNSFSKWKDPSIIADACRIVYVTRPGVSIDQSTVSQYRMINLNYDKSGSVSSGDVRALHSMDIPVKVRDYIEDKELYYIKKVKSYLTPQRYAHSLSVANLSYYIALKNQVVNYKDAYIAGLLHDIGKDIEEKRAFQILNENYHDYADLPEFAYHQFVGAYMAKTEFGITDEEIIDAIEFHATGKTHMPPLTKIIYSADKIEPTRGYDSLKLIDQCLRNYYVGFLAVLRANRDFLASKGYDYDNPLTQGCMNLYMGGQNK